MPPIFYLSEKVRDNFTGIMAGFLDIRDAALSRCLPELAILREKLEAELRNNYSGMERNDLKRIHELKIYSDYYKKFKKTYHVLLQLESVALRGKGIPEAPPLCPDNVHGRAEKPPPHSGS